MKKLFLIIFLILFVSYAHALPPSAPTPAKQSKTDTSNFDGVLDSDDNTVQKALDTLDDYAPGGGDMAAAVWDGDTNGFIDQDAGGLNADISGYGAGLLGHTAAGATQDTDTEAELETALGSINIIVSTEIDGFSEIQTLVSDKTLLNEEDAATIDQDWTFTTGFALGATGDITQTTAAVDWDMVDDNASALSFDAGGKAGILAIVTSNGSEGVTMSGTLGVTGLTTTTAGILSANNITLDDDTTDSPGLVLRDSDEATLTMTKLQAGGSSIVDSDGAILIEPSGDTSDYLTVSTASDIITISTVGGADGDLVITAAGGEISFGDENLSTTGTLGAGATTISTLTASGLITGNANAALKNGSTSAGSLSIYEDSDDGSNYSTITVGAQAGDVTYILPAAQGTTNQYLQLANQATGQLQWNDPSGTGDITAVGNVASSNAFTGSDGDNNTGYQLYFEGATNNNFEILLTSENPGADYTITLSAETGTVMLGPSDLGSDNILVKTDGTGNLTQATGLTVDDSDNISGAGNITLGASKVISGSTALTLGGGSETIAINSSDWDIDATGIMTGIGNITSNGVVTATGFTIGSAAILEAELEILDGATLGTADLNIIDGIADSGSLTAAELLYVDGVTSAIQTQLDARALESVIGDAIEADDLELSGTTLQLAAEVPHVDAAQAISADWEWQDDTAFSIGDDNDWEVVYDETTDDRLEYVHTAGAGADVYWDLNDNVADSTFTITNSDGTYDANLTVDKLTVSSADGSNYIALTNNTAISPSGNRLYFEGNEFKISENGSEETVLTNADGATLTGTSWDFSSVTNFVLPSAAADASGEMSISAGNTLKWHDGAKVVTIDTTTTTDNYVLKYDNATATFNLEADATGGTPAWNDVTDPTADVTIDHDANEETNFTFTGDYTTGSQFLVQQLTGNPSGGVLFEARGADSDSVVARFGDGTNYWQVSTAAQLSNAGTGTLNFAAASDLLVGGGQIDADDLAGSANFTTTGDFIHGADPADSGDIRLSNAESIMFEAAPAGTDISALSVDSSEVVQIGASGASAVTITPATDIVGALTAASVASDAAVSGTTITASTGFALGDGDYIGITGNEIITFNAAGSIAITGATFDVDGALTASTVGSDGAVTATTNVVIGDAGNIGSASDADSIAIAANGEVTLSQELQAGAGIDVSGGTLTAGTIAGTLSDGTASWNTSTQILAGFASLTSTAIVTDSIDVTGAADLDIGSADVTDISFYSDGDFAFVPPADTDIVLNFTGTTAQGSITYMEDEDRFDFDNDVDVIGDLTAATITSDAGVSGTTGTFSGIVTGLVNTSNDPANLSNFNGSFTVSAAGSTSLTLPSAAAGYSICLFQGQGRTDTLTVTPNTGDYIVDGGTRGTAATAYASAGAASDKICLVAVDADDWYVTSITGTWSE
jgi:hypothetical protein